MYEYDSIMVCGRYNYDKVEDYYHDASAYKTAHRSDVSFVVAIIVVTIVAAVVAFIFDNNGVDDDDDV